jgi:5-methylcytosine-specific restriction protein A
MVIFGAWDVQKEQERSVILRELWKSKVVDGRTRKNWDTFKLLNTSS